GHPVLCDRGNWRPEEQAAGGGGGQGGMPAPPGKDARLQSPSAPLNRLAPWIRKEAMPGLQVTQIDHVSVLVTDLERSRRFYRDLLGLKEIAKPRTFDFKVLWFDLGNQQLHLLQKERPDTRS